MSPRPILLFLALLLGARSAVACPACEAPSPRPEASVDAGPDAVFRPDAPGALEPQEALWLSSLENGRYARQPGAIVDTRAPDPLRHALTNAQVQSLLARNATARVAALREKARAGPLERDAHAEAVTLFWTRGPLLNEADRQLLRDLIMPHFGKAPEPGKGPGAPPVAGGSGALSAPAAAEAEALLNTLVSRVTLVDHDDPRQAAGLRDAFRGLLASQTGREMAQQFIAEGATAKVSFEQIEGSHISSVNGRMVLNTSGGHAKVAETPVHVVLNRHYLDTDPDYRRVKVAGTLAHELFGHAFERQRADKLKITDSLYHYRGDEAGSGLLGWLVETELGGRVSNGHMWNYLRDPEVYHRGLQTNLPYYAATFSVEEMKNPIDTLRARRAQVEESRASMKAWLASTVAWRPRAQHFIDVHKMDAAVFGTIFESIKNTEIWAESHDKDLNDIGAYMDEMTGHWSSPKGRAYRDRVVNQSRSPYFAQAEARLKARQERLRLLVGARQPESQTPPIPGHLQMQDLYDLYDKDRLNNPNHWPPQPGEVPGARR